MIALVLAVAALGGIMLAAVFIQEEQLSSSLAMRNRQPMWPYLFGTDWLGRDMLARTVKGLSISLQIGLFGALGSVCIAMFFSLLSTFGRWADVFVGWLIDLFLSLPHLVTMILIAFVMGGGIRGVLVGIALTHWPSLARVLRAELLQVKHADYVLISRAMGRSRRWVATRHLLPHLLPQMLVGFLLMFPHAILHEAAITFIGLGVPPDQPAIGVILSEAMRYLSTGMWWLALFPGLALLIMVRLFDRFAHYWQMLLNPRQYHR